MDEVADARVFAGFHFRTSCEDGNHLGSEGFVDFDNFGVRQAQPGLLFRPMNRMHGAQPHS